MRKLIVLLTLISLAFINYSCSGPTYSIAKESDTGKHVIVGELSWNQWQRSAGWKTYEAEDYIPTVSVTDQIAKEYAKGELEFVIVSGSWCHDSEKGMPEIIEILRLSKVPFEDIKIYGVDRNKSEPSGYAKSVNIDKVPTLIISRSDKEIGRIVEKPTKSWEFDINKIVLK